MLAGPGLSTASDAFLTFFMKLQEIVSLIASCMDQSASHRPTARAVFEGIRDAMIRHRLPADDSAMLHHKSSLQAEVERRNSMREGLNKL